MKAIVCGNGKSFECKISRDKNKIILEFLGEKVPYPVIQTCEFNVNMKPEVDEIDCTDCESCLTPIC